MTDTDLFVYCPCTSPFIKPETVSQCINQFISTSDYDCLATVSSVKEFLWLDGDPMNYDPAHAPNSQDLPDVVALNFGVTVVRKEDLIKTPISSVKILNSSRQAILSPLILILLLISILLSSFIKS